MSLQYVPGRAFLDTSVVNFILDYGEQIHDGALIPENSAEQIVQDVETLRERFKSQVATSFSIRRMLAM